MKNVLAVAIACLLLLSACVANKEVSSGQQASGGQSVQSEDASSAAGTPGSGEDSSAAEELPVRTIADEQELRGLAEMVNAGDTSYLQYVWKLTQDIELGDEKWVPIGKDEGFGGIFDGQGHTVKNVLVAEPFGSAAGFFGTVCAGTVKNLYIEGDISGVDEVGGLAGRLSGDKNASALLYNCSFTGSISGHTCVGGLVGSTYGSVTVSRCMSDSVVTGTVRVGGLLGGVNEGASIENSFCLGEVLAKTVEDNEALAQLMRDRWQERVGSNLDVQVSYIGGFIGDNNFSTVRSCYTNSAVKCYALSGFIGAFSSYTNGLLENCYFNSELNGHWKTVGYIYPNEFAEKLSVTGLTGPQFRERQSFPGWDFDEIWELQSGSPSPMLRPAI